MTRTMVVVWPLMVALALLGWGLVAAAAARRWADVDLRSPADALPLGIAVYLAVAGVAVALDLHTRWFTTAMVVLGIGIAAVALVARTRDRRTRSFGAFSVAAALVALLLVITLWQAARFIWNACDDDLAYLYLARRLVDTGNLLDPLNNRRVTSLGGMSSLQALFLGHLPDPALLLADQFLGPLLLLVQLWRTSAGRWSGWGIAAAFALTSAPGNLFMKNSSPAFLGAGLALAVYRFALRARVPSDGGQGAVGTDPRRPRAAERDRLVLGAALGIVVAATATLRAQYALALIPFAVVATLLPPIRRSTIASLAGLAGGGAVGVVGWMVASWRADGTPMYPIGGGNVDPAWPANGPDVPGPTLTGLLDRLVNVLVSPWVGIAVLVAFLVLVVAGMTTAARTADATIRWGTRIHGVAIGTTVLALVVLAVVWWVWGSPAVYARFWMPLVFAAVLFPLAFVTAHAGSGRRAAVLGGAAFAACLLVTVGGWDLDPKAVATDTATGRTLQLLSADRYGHLEADYDHVSAMIAPGSKVLATVDVPSLLLGHGFEVHTLDLVGSTSPAPHLPYFKGPEAKLSWARDHGYTYVVATDPAASACLYNAGLQEKALAAGGVYGAWAPWELDWFRFLGDVTAAHPPMGVVTTRVGSLILVEV